MHAPPRPGPVPENFQDCPAPPHPKNFLMPRPEAKKAAPCIPGTYHIPDFYLCLFLPFVECVCQEGEALVGLVHQGPIGPQALMISYEIDIKTN